MTVLAPPRLLARTVEVDLTGPLVAHLPAGTAPAELVAWVREGDGIVGWGRAAECPTTGPGRFARAEEWWRQVSEHAQVADEVGEPGTGLVAFGSFSFADDSPRGGLLVVPEVVVGRRRGRAWITTVTAADSRARVIPDLSAVRSRQAHRGAAPALEVRPGAVPPERWPEVVSAGVARIAAGDVEKVVLARDLVVRAEPGLDAGAVLARLTGRYAATWTFAVDGLVGATPEMLVRLQDGQVRSRVLAGTVRRDRRPAPQVTEAHPELDAAHRSDPRIGLVSSDKELEEHAFAVRSVADALRPHCRDLGVPSAPFVLELPDVYHLATDLRGTLDTGATSLRLAAALHPSAAVCGTPADAAARVIAELEGMDRGRYAGPVGWMDARGDGDWGIALRCGQLAEDARSIRLFAGGGIVAASDPEAELAETEAKLAAMRYALGG